MDSKALVAEQIEAAADLIERFDKFLPVRAAFWLKLADEETWSLYIVADRIGEEGVAPGYGEVVRLCQEINSPYLDLFRVRLIPADHLFAAAAAPFYQRYPGKFPIHYGGTMLGGISIDGAYLYPAPAATANP